MIRSTLYRWSVYWEMFRSQLKDRNANQPLSWRERFKRGHRLGTMSSICIKGPPYKSARWMKRRV